VSTLDILAQIVHVILGLGKSEIELEKLLLNTTIENKEMASYRLKQPYQILEKVNDKADFLQMRCILDKVRMYFAENPE